MFVSRFPVVAAFVIALAGCAMPISSVRQPVALPADWKNAAGFPVASADRDLMRWWGRFEDPTMSRVIRLALAGNSDIVSASAKIRESRARRAAEATALFPFLNGSTSVGPSATHRDGLGSDSQTSYSAALNASWEADLYGKNRSRVQAATAQVHASEENFYSVQTSLASEVAIAYTSLRTNEAVLEVFERTVKSREETWQLASWRTRSGESDSLESSQALSSLEQARASIPVLQQSISQSRNLLSLLAGRTPGELDSLLANGRRNIPHPPRGLAVGIPADTLRQRPDVRLAGYQLVAAAANTNAARAERFPSLNLSGSLGLNALGSVKLFNPQTASAGVIAGMSGPIFDAGRIRANVLAQSAVEEQVFQTYRSTILTALSEVEDTLIACRRTGERLDILEKATTAAREAATLAEQRYEAGVTDILTVLDSQRTLLGLENTLYNVRADRTVAYIQLYKALGGGWS